MRKGNRTRREGRTKALMVSYAVLQSVATTEVAEFYALMMLGALGALERDELDRRFKKAIREQPEAWKKAKKAVFPDGELFRMLKAAIEERRS